jgi:hypothetical protein
VSVADVVSFLGFWTFPVGFEPGGAAAFVFADFWASVGCLRGGILIVMRKEG